MVDSVHADDLDNHLGREVGRNSVNDARIAEFWAWFAHHKSDLARVQSDRSAVLDELLQRLQRIDRKLCFEICTNRDPHELIVTAQGRRELFSLVGAVVAAAPRLEGWNFIALKPAMGFTFRTSYGGTNFDPQSMWFCPLESSSNGLGLRVGVPEFDPDQERKTTSAILVILETGLGERAAASEIHYVEVAALPSKPEGHGYIELTELADYIGWRKRWRAGQVDPTPRDQAALLGREKAKVDRLARCATLLRFAASTLVALAILFFLYGCATQVVGHFVGSALPDGQTEADFERMALARSRQRSVALSLVAVALVLRGASVLAARRVRSLGERVVD